MRKISKKQIGAMGLAVMMTAQSPAMAAEMTAAFGLSCFSSAAADAETATATDSAAANKNAHGF